MWCLPSGEFATLQGPKFDYFYVSRALCRPFATVHESDTRSSMTSRYLLWQAITHSHRHHAAASALSSCTRFCATLLPRFRPRRFCSRCGSSGLRHRRNSCGNCRSTRRRHLCRCLPLSKRHGQLFHCHFYFCQPRKRRSQVEHKADSNEVGRRAHENHCG
jgi:hypothetical protein